MRTTFRSMMAAGLLATAGSGIIAAPGQDRPGQMTEARVWVENRGRDQAIPVELRAVQADTLLRVRVVNGEPSTQSEPVPVVAKLVRQPWDYETIVVPPDTPPASVLSARGLVGWETTGIAWTGTDRSTTLLLKRVR